VLSIPLTFFAGIGSAAKSGVLVKGSNYIEILAKSKTVIFDKTGTLTTGNFEVTKICSLKEMAEDEILEFIAYGESFSNHRIAKSIVAHYTKTTQKTINTAWVNGSNEIAGGGIVANIFMTDCIIGNAEFLQKNGIDVPSVDAYETIVFLACGGECQGYVCVADSLKNDAVEATADLKKMGLKTYMFTGDNQKVAEHIAATCGLDGYRAGLLPAEKLEHLADFSASGKVAFVGDGINDAPALTKADVGIAMGGLGSDIAVESADVVLMTDEPSKLVEAIKISRNTEKLVVENAVLTIGIKIASLILVSFGLGGMWLAVFADVGVSVLAVLNSMRAMKRYNKKTINNEK
jgi:Cd2+/Zn2+-exporting ATPase